MLKYRIVNLTLVFWVFGFVVFCVHSYFPNRVQKNKGIKRQQLKRANCLLAEPMKTLCMSCAIGELVEKGRHLPVKKAKKLDADTCSSWGNWCSEFEGGGNDWSFFLTILDEDVGISQDRKCAE